MQSKLVTVGLYVKRCAVIRLRILMNDRQVDEMLRHDIVEPAATQRANPSPQPSATQANVRGLKEPARTLRCRMYSVSQKNPPTS